MGKKDISHWNLEFNWITNFCWNNKMEVSFASEIVILHSSLLFFKDVRVRIHEMAKSKKQKHNEIV